MTHENKGAELFTREVCGECKNWDGCLGALPCPHCSGGYVYTQVPPSPEPPGGVREAEGDIQDPRTDQELVDTLENTALKLGAEGGELGSEDELLGDKLAILDRMAFYRRSLLPAPPAPPKAPEGAEAEQYEICTMGGGWIVYRASKNTLGQEIIAHCSFKDRAEMICSALSRLSASTGALRQVPSPLTRPMKLRAEIHPVTDSLDTRYLMITDGDGDCALSEEIGEYAADEIAFRINAFEESGEKGEA